MYTPQPIVDFMCAAVEEVLLNEFGKKLGDNDVYVIDPCTGTGNFAVNLLLRARSTNPRTFEQFYRYQLFANEVMLMPYYIASLNIEHAYYELTGKYEPFDGICFVDTLDLAEGAQMKLSFMTERNTERVERQKRTPITVILGNPPYNMGQLNANDNNKNRSYKIIDKNIADTYSKDSGSNNRNALYDAYVKFFRWATDRLEGRDGIVCFVTNNGFIDGKVFNGMRKHLMNDYHRIFHLDLHGNVRHNPKLSGTTHNVFGIKVGVGITIAIRKNKYQDHKMYYHRVPEFWTAKEKLNSLGEHIKVQGQQDSLYMVNWDEVHPDTRYSWIIPQNTEEYEKMLPIGIKSAKQQLLHKAEAIFHQYARGILTARDSTVYNYSRQRLSSYIKTVIGNFNSETDRYKRENQSANIDEFVDYSRLDWSHWLKQHLKQGHYITHNVNEYRSCLYRPFSKQNLYFNPILINSPTLFRYFLPNPKLENENKIIAVTDVKSEKPFMVMLVETIVDFHLVGAGAGCQCFPFYTYNEDGTNRRENITDWSLAQFRKQYKDGKISKWDIFYYVYGLLHHPSYRTKFADNLKRELPRIPFAADFWSFAEMGQKLADLHLNYETVKPYPLEWITTPNKPINYRVEKMKLTKTSDLIYNDTLTLRGIPLETFEYKLGNRSALHWIIDQYQVSTDKRSGITSDPNTYSDDERYIVNLIERIVQVSLETAKITNELQSLPFLQAEGAAV